MSFGIVATDVAQARRLGDSLRTASGVFAGADNTATVAGDMVFADATEALVAVSTTAAAWRRATHDAVAAIALGVEIAADETERADR